MKIELKVGSIWQLVGSDNFDSLIGSPPIGIVHSEHAVADPRASAFLRPILAENGGWSLYIYTSRGYNHGYTTYQNAKGVPTAFAQLLTVEDTPVFSRETLDIERKWYMDEYGVNDGDALFRQEMYCDFSAANIGAILGRYVEVAEKENRILEADLFDPEWPVDLSCDIGFRDTAAWWFWQRRPDGFHLIDYDEDTGLDAEDWIDRLRKKPYDFGKIYLPHDARAKTFATKRSVVEQFVEEFSPAAVRIVPKMKTQDRINAARRIMPKCRFHRSKCKQGLDGLRSWSFKYDEERKTFSKEPDHNWASHPGDGFSYGAIVMNERPETDFKPHDPLKFVNEPVRWDEDIWQQDEKVERI